MGHVKVMVSRYSPCWRTVEIYGIIISAAGTPQTIIQKTNKPLGMNVLETLWVLPTADFVINFFTFLGFTFLICLWVKVRDTDIK